MQKPMLSIRMMALGILSLAYTSINAQGTFTQVYNILQTNCSSSSCHDNTSPEAGLSLIGTGMDPEGDVYNALVEQAPTNSYAAAQGYVRINPGDPHTSVLFRSINEGFDDHITLNVLEGTHPSLIMSDAEKELIRQWILFGAPENGTVVDTSIIQDYYTLGGIQSMPVRPAAPDSGEGFQIHFGPFFIPPGSEKEYFLKYDPGFTDTLESNRIDILMAGNSHHFILDRFIQGEEANVQEGYRFDGAHLTTEGITAAQFSGPQYLPEKTAFLLPEAAWLDLNSHYINFSPDSILKAEVYINVYTQPHGTAKQIMYTTGGLGGLDFPNILNVPNDGSTYTFEGSWHSGSTFPLMNDVFVWTMNSHTHQWGKDFDIYKRTSTGARGEHLFDASNIEGDPLGIYFGYYYEEPPSREFDPFLFVPKAEGFIFEASYVNTGPNNNVGWGLTSEDEMFIMGIFYVLDTAGLSTVGVPNIVEGNDGLVVYPNPARSTVCFDFKQTLSGKMEVYNTLGERVRVIALEGNSASLAVSKLPAGVYVYHIQSDGYDKSGRFSIAH